MNEPVTFILLDIHDQQLQTGTGGAAAQDRD